MPKSIFFFFFAKTLLSLESTSLKNAHIKSKRQREERELNII